MITDTVRRARELAAELLRVYHATDPSSVHEAFAVTLLPILASPPSPTPVASSTPVPGEALVPCSVCAKPTPMPEFFRVYCGKACSELSTRGMWQAPKETP